MVKYNLSDVHAEKESALNVKTLGLYSSVGVQADCGLVVDREVRCILYSNLRIVMYQQNRL